MYSPPPFPPDTQGTGPCGRTGGAVGGLGRRTRTGAGWWIDPSRIVFFSVAGLALLVAATRPDTSAEWTVRTQP
jgi:hypothetical protein